MSPSRSSKLPAEPAEETTPKPASSVTSVVSARSQLGVLDSSRRTAERRAALLDHFANPSPTMRAMDAAWEEAIALYGDEDSDAWVSALEDGTHPLCRVGSLAHRA